MKAKHIPLLISIATVAAASWYFVTRNNKKSKPNNKKHTNGNTAQNAVNSATADSGNATNSNTNGHQGNWLTAKINPELYTPHHIDLTKSNVLYSWQKQNLWIKGSVYLKVPQKTLTLPIMNIDEETRQAQYSTPDFDILLSFGGPKNSIFTLGIYDKRGDEDTWIHDPDDSEHMILANCPHGCDGVHHYNLFYLGEPCPFEVEYTLGWLTSSPFQSVR